MRTAFALGTAAVLLVLMQYERLPLLDALSMRTVHLVSFALATPVQFWAEWRFTREPGRSGATARRT